MSPLIDPQETAILLGALTDPGRAAILPPERIPVLLIRLTALQGVLAARLGGAYLDGRPAPARPSGYLTVREAAGLLKVSSDTVYRRWQRAPGAKKFGREIRIPVDDLHLLGDVPPKPGR